MTSLSYVVVHETKYAYAQSVGVSRQIVHKRPRDLPWQTCRAHVMTVSPEPEIVSRGFDAFGNPTTALCIENDHDALVVRAESLVDIVDRRYPDDASTPPWEDVRTRLSYRAGHRLDV